MTPASAFDREHDLFSPGDRIIITHGNGAEHVHEVLDPPYTSQGKVRLRGPRGGLDTAWWSPSTCDGRRQGSKTWRVERA